MSATLRPMRLGELLDRTFQLYRSRFWPLAASWLPLALAMLVIELADVHGFHFQTLFRPRDQGERIIWNAVVGLAYYHVSSLLASLVIPSVVLQASGQVLGDPRTTAQTLAFSVRRWRRHLWLGIQRVTFNLLLVEVCGLVAYLGLFAFIGWLASHNPLGWMALALLLPFPAVALAFLWVGACTALAFPVCVLEDTTAWKSMRRSWSLSRESRARIALTWFLLFVASWAAWGMLRYALQLSLWLLWHWLHMHWNPVYPMAAHGIYAAFATLFGPIYPVFVTLVYYDQRIRKEGFDIEWMMSAAGMSAGTDAFPVAMESGNDEVASVPVEGAGA